MNRDGVYVFQLVDARTGDRSPWFDATPDDLVKTFRENDLHVQPADDDEEARLCMVLVLGRAPGEEGEEEGSSVFPPTATLELCRVPLMYSWNFCNFVANYCTH